ncbi:hypothetical protein ACJX0J_007660, partial [Zea mays]
IDDAWEVGLSNEIPDMIDLKGLIFIKILALIQFIRLVFRMVLIASAANFLHENSDLLSVWFGKKDAANLFVWGVGFIYLDLYLNF